jgi:hypothetical protein
MEGWVWELRRAVGIYWAADCARFYTARRTWRNEPVFNTGRHFDVESTRHRSVFAYPCHVLPIEVHIRVARTLLGAKGPFTANHVHMNDNPMAQLHASLTAEGGRTGRESNIAMFARRMRIENAILRNGHGKFAAASAACNAQRRGRCRLCRLPLFEPYGSDVKIERLRGSNDSKCT